MVYRLDVPTAAPSPPPIGNIGTEGFPTAGVPGVTAPATIDPYFNYALCEEIRNVVVAAGITPDKAAVNQLLLAVQGWAGKNSQVFNSSGTFTVPAGVTKIRVTCTGGGGGGANASSTTLSGSTNYSGGGGGAAGTAIGLYAVTPGAGISVTVGAGAPPGSQGAGGTSSFGAYCSATGGSGSTFQITGNSAGAGGGSGSGGAVNVNGGDGSDGQFNSSQLAGNGGDSYWGGGGRAGAAGGYSSGVPGAGGGGSYSSTSGTGGGGGSDGVVVVEW